MTGTIGLLLLVNAALIGKAEVIELYVATNGNDSWSGGIESPNLDGTDGPFARLRGQGKSL